MICIIAGGETGQDGLDGPVNSGSTHPNDRLLQKACLERCDYGQMICDYSVQLR